jgi:hypothetical protein
VVAAPADEDGGQALSIRDIDRVAAPDFDEEVVAARASEFV